MTRWVRSFLHSLYQEFQLPDRVNSLFPCKMIALFQRSKAQFRYCTSRRLIDNCSEKQFMSHLFDTGDAERANMCHIYTWDVINRRISTIVQCDTTNVNEQLENSKHFVTGDESDSNLDHLFGKLKTRLILNICFILQDHNLFNKIR